MKTVFIFFIAVLMITLSCKKEEEVPSIPFDEQLAIDLEIIDTYLVDNNIENVLKDCRTDDVPFGQPCEGYVSYVQHVEGDGLTPPNLGTKVKVSYVGRLLSTGVVFDENDTVDFTLGGLITGWQAILLDMQEGDSVTMYIPSGYAYGTSGKGDDIPANSNLIFDMKLHQVN